MNLMGNRFDERDAEEILKRAAAMDGNAEIDRAIMERTAAELGISPESLARAEAEYMKERERTRYVEEFIVQRRTAFMAQVGTYVAVNVLLVAIWAVTSRGAYFWPMWPMFGWGIGLVLQYIQMSKPNSEQFQREFAEWKLRRGV